MGKGTTVVIVAVVLACTPNDIKIFIFIVKAVFAAILFLAKEFCCVANLGCRCCTDVKCVVIIDIKCILLTALLYVCECYSLAVPFVGRSASCKKIVDVVNLLGGGV